jgi:PHD/YefM family antitoxin component YafN of YafNO toxin-antitoxin module
MAHRLENHPRIRASDVKKRGWKAVSTLARERGPLVVTNHSQAEVVVIDAARYQAMVERLEASDPLEALKRRFDQRLERLEGEAAGDALTAAIDAEPEELAHAANQRAPETGIDDDSDEHAKP